MKRPPAVWIAALALAACGGSAADKGGEPASMNKSEKSARETPWSIAYADGSANVYRFAQASPGAQVEFEYVPIRPEQSNTGTYSGGEPREAKLSADDARVDELWRRLEAIEADSSVRTEERGKGTGAFTLSTPAGKREFIIQMGPALDELHRFIAAFRD